MIWPLSHKARIVLMVGKFNYLLTSGSWQTLKTPRKLSSSNKMLQEMIFPNSHVDIYCSEPASYSCPIFIAFYVSAISSHMWFF